MQTTLLNDEQFVATHGATMEDVTFSSGPVFDIWPYIEQLVTDGLVLPLVYENKLVEKVYRNPQLSIDHILLPTQKQNVFVVVLVDVPGDRVLGHHVLDLNDE